MSHNFPRRQNFSQTSRTYKFILGFVIIPIIFYFERARINSFFNDYNWDNNIKTLFSEAIFAVILTAICYFGCHLARENPSSFLGLEANRKRYKFLLGLVISGVLLLLTFICDLTFGLIQLKDWGWQEKQLSGVVSDAFIEFSIVGIGAWIEELVVRGYILQALEDCLNNCYFAIILSSTFFGYIHTSGHEPFWGILIGTSVIGVFLALGRYFTQSLWLSIGLHFGWNVFEGIIFGFKVSGNDDFLKCHFICQDLTPLGGKREMFTGGEYGPEAGIIGGIAAILGCIALCFLTNSAKLDTRE